MSSSAPTATIFSIYPTNLFTSSGAYLGNNALTAVCTYIFVYFCSIGLVCLLFSNTYQITNNIPRLIKFSCNNSKSSILLVLAFCSLAGIPPFAGFFSKLLLTYVILKKYNLLLSFLLFLLLFISFFFYLQFIKLARKNITLTKTDLKAYKNSTKTQQKSSTFFKDFLVVFFLFLILFFFFFFKDFLLLFCLI